MTALAMDYDAADLARVKAAREFVHKLACPEPRRTHETSCVACPTATGTLLALRCLDERPRDARGARRALHDVVCRSSCSPEDSDHADQTQSAAAAALRKFHAQEAR